MDPSLIDLDTGSTPWVAEEEPDLIPDLTGAAVTPDPTVANNPGGVTA